MGSILKVDNLQNSDGTRTLASDSGTAWSWGANAPPGMVIEQFCSPCDGSSITVQSGTYTVQNVTGAQALTTSFATIDGSSISYKPPTGTQTVKYDFNFQLSYESSSHISSYKLFLGDNEVTKFRTVLSVQTGSSWENKVHYTWAFHIGGSADTTVGRVASWSSALTIKLEALEYGSTNQAKLHTTGNTFGASGSNTTVTNLPVIGITAIA